MYSQIVLDKSLFLFSSWFSNASLIFVLSYTQKNLLSHLKRLRLQTRDPSLNVLTQLPLRPISIWNGSAVLPAPARLGISTLFGEPNP